MTDEDDGDDLRGVLAEVRRRAGAAPRRVSLMDRWRVRVRKPYWLGPERDVWAGYDGFSRLLREGDIAWGASVQVNMEMFEPGPDDLPGVVVVDAEHRFDDAPHELVALANELVELREDPGPSGELKRIGELLAAETANIFEEPLPDAAARGTGAHWSAILFFRKHLPYGHVTSELFPVLWHPEVRSVCVLPSIWWPESFVRRDYPVPVVPM